MVFIENESDRVRIEGEIEARNNFIRDYVTRNYSAIVDQIRGRDGGVRPSKPSNKRSNGLVQYIWRWCRFHSGSDVSMPITASWDLDKWIKDQGHIKIGGILTQADKDIYNYLDDVAMRVVRDFGGSNMAGLSCWKRALYGQY